MPPSLRTYARGRGDAWTITAKGNRTTLRKRRSMTARKHREPRMLSAAELARTKIYLDYVRARTRAAAEGIFSGELPPAMRVRPDCSLVDQQKEYAAFERRVEFLVELEVWWRLGELGVPHDDEKAAHFEPFRFGSHHLRRLEEMDREMKEETRRRNAAEAAARHAAKANAGEKR